MNEDEPEEITASENEVAFLPSTNSIDSVRLRFVKIFKCESDRTTTIFSPRLQEISTIFPLTVWRAISFIGFQESFLIEVLRNMITSYYPCNQYQDPAK